MSKKLKIGNQEIGIEDAIILHDQLFEESYQLFLNVLNIKSEIIGILKSRQISQNELDNLFEQENNIRQKLYNATQNYYGVCVIATELSK